MRSAVAAAVIALLTLVAGCGYDPPPVVGQRYRIINVHTEPARQWRTANYSCVRWDEDGWCVEEEFSGWTYHYDDPDYIVTIKQCWPKPGKPVWEGHRIVRVEPNDEQKCIDRDLYVFEHRYQAAVAGKTFVVSRHDSVYDGDVDT